MKAGLTIGELANALQLNPKTIRYYEGIGLLPRPRRSESGYRLYSGKEVERLRLVKRVKLLGLSLGEIKEIVGYAIDQRCGTLKHHLLSLLEVKLAEVDQKIQELAILKEDLQRYRQQLAQELEERAGGRTTASDTCECIPGHKDSCGK